VFCALTWDSSTFGWAALTRWWDMSRPAPVLRELLLVGMWPDGWDFSEQPFREALGGALAFEAFAQAVDIRGLYCILRNDAAAAIAAVIADRALCVLVLPVAILATYWSKLLRASVLPRAAPYVDGFLRIRAPSARLLYVGGYTPGELAVFACDFGRLAPRPGLPQLAVSPRAFSARLLPPCGGG
jgi:hypothetical protein